MEGSEQRYQHGGSEWRDLSEEISAVGSERRDLSERIRAE